MNRRAATEGARLARMPARAVIVLALMAASAPGWSQTAPVQEAPVSTPPAPAPEQRDPTIAVDSPPSTDALPVATTAQSDAPPAADASSPVADAPQASLPAGDTPPAADTAPSSTAAEADFNELYGTESANGQAASAPPATYDPWERYNRRVHRFNNAVDRRVAKPLAHVYVKVVPRPVRSGVGNFFSNLGQPASAVNALLQGRPKQAAHSLGRFVINSTIGLGGVFDPATTVRLQNRNEDFGQTLGVWGWKRSRYVELPFFGPRTLRDVVGMVGDAPLSPMRQVQSDRVRIPLQGLQLVDLRATLMSTDSLREGAEDDYALVRDAWMQRRAYQIDGDRTADDVPDYLKDDPNMVPVGAMPVSGGH